jgi:hypothetical protein
LRENERVIIEKRERKKVGGGWSSLERESFDRNIIKNWGERKERGGGEREETRKGGRERFQFIRNHSKFCHRAYFFSSERKGREKLNVEEEQQRKSRERRWRRRRKKRRIKERKG